MTTLTHRGNVTSETAMELSMELKKLKLLLPYDSLGHLSKGL
jgi:hypothetical protein